MLQAAAHAAVLPFCACRRTLTRLHAWQPCVVQTWLRVALGYHTWPQVLVGAALGAATATGWLHLGTTAVLPALQHHGGAKAVLFGVTGAAMAAFSVKNVLSWARERKQQAAAASAPRRQPPPPAAAAAT